MQHELKKNYLKVLCSDKPMIFERNFIFSNLILKISVKIVNIINR